MTPSLARTSFRLVGACAFALLFGATSDCALAHGSGNHNGSGIQYRAGSNSGNWRDNAVLHWQDRATTTNKPPLHWPGSSHKPIVRHPVKIRPPVATVGPKKLPPSATGCHPNCVDPNLPPGALIYVDDGHKHCVVENRPDQGSCDPNIPDTGVHGRGGPDQGRHHLN